MAANEMPDRDFSDDDLSQVLARLSNREPSGLNNQTVDVASNLRRDRYHPSSADNRSLPGRILPAGMENGASLAFDAHIAKRVVIDPDENGRGGFTIDMSRITPDQAKRAADAVGKLYPHDPKARGVAYYAVLARMQTESAKTAQAQPVAPPPFDVSKIPSASGERGQREPPLRLPSSILSYADAVPTIPASNAMNLKKPRRVDFELQHDSGIITCHYHDVIQGDSILVLVVNKASVEMRYLPSPKTDDDPDNPTRIGVLVYDEFDQPDMAYAVVATPVRFSYQDLEFCVLAIDNAKSAKMEENNVRANPHQGMLRKAGDHIPGMDATRGFPETLAGSQGGQW
jgi:hypothetical protein